jgi:D-alanyl-D-alanine carboxypeptidase
MANTKHRKLRALLPVLALCTVYFLFVEHSHGRDPFSASYHPELQSHRADFQALLEAAVNDGLPGVSLRVVGAGIDFQGAAGVADLRTGEPLTPAHTIYTASLGKTFTATVALQLCEEGRLELDAPVSRWLPGDVAARIPSTDTITLRHLLSHTSGLMDYMNDQKSWRSEFVRNPRRLWSHSEVIAFIFHRPLLFQPGSDFDYSNSNYILAGMMIERVTGRPLDQLINERIIRPLKLVHSSAGGAPLIDVHPVRGYARPRGRIIDTYPWYSHYALADSGIHSTPSDLARFMAFLFRDDLLLSEQTKKQMLTASNVGHPPSDYGLGIYVQRNPWGAGKTWYAHDGVDPGYQADMMYLPELDLAIVLAANASLGSANLVYEGLVRDVIRAALDSIL